MDDEEERKLEAYLQNEATQLERDREVERVVGCFKMDPFALLELPYQYVERDVKVAYRRKSLLVHPDKARHPRAQEAFDLLKKAETELTNEKRRDALLQLVEEAQHHTQKQHRDTNSPQFRETMQQRLKEVLIEEELRRRRLLKREMEMESREVRKTEAVIEERKRKKQSDKVWEDARDVRVGNWRDFLAGGKSKKAGKKRRGELRPPKAVAEAAATAKKPPPEPST